MTDHSRIDLFNLSKLFIMTNNEIERKWKCITHRLLIVVNLAVMLLCDKNKKKMQERMKQMKNIERYLSFIIVIFKTICILSHLMSK